jgi:small-conductance mechanosensitive channel
MELLNETFFDNSVKTWLIALGVTVATFVVLRLVQGVLVVRLEKLTERTRTEWDDLVVDALRKTKSLFLVVVAIFAGATLLDLSGTVRSILRSTTVIAFLVQAGLWASSGLMFWLQSYRKRQIEEDAASVMTMNAIGFIVRLALWSVVLLLALDNLGVDVTALVAGLGVGGIAVALAVQNILGDLFASLSIVLDKPFVIGDFIIVGDLLGTVENIGIKTTRVRSLSGEQLIFSNADLLGSRIRNYGRMHERRVVFTIGVTYQTPRATLEKIPTIIREAVASQDKTRFDRSHFKAFGDFSLNFETVYYVDEPAYNVYMDIQQAINFDLHRRFEELDIEFAYPTQTIFLAKESA